MLKAQGAVGLKKTATVARFLTSPKWGVGLNPHRLHTVFLHSVQRLKLGVSVDPMFSSTLQRGQLPLVVEAGAGAGAGLTTGASSFCSTEMVLGGFLDLAGGVSGAESESGGDPGGEKGESGGEPGPESGGDPGGESAALSSSPVTRLVAELNRDDPKLNI